MARNLFDVLDKENLTRLNVSYDWRTDRVFMLASREWDETVDWSAYNHSFLLATPLTASPCQLPDADVWDLFERYGLRDHLERVVGLLRKGRHHFIDCLYCGPLGIRFMNNVHSDLLGLNNRSHAIRAGGIRRHGPDENEIDVIIDGLNLGRGMSFKNFAARIPYGGNKITVMMDPLDLGDMKTLGFLSYALDCSRNFTGPDMDFPPEMADVLKRHFTMQITGGPNGPLGPTGTPTAYGVYLAARQAAKFKWGSESLVDKRVAVQGLGAVGEPLAVRYLEDGAFLIVADKCEDRAAAFKEKHGERVEVVSSDGILGVEADLFSPCAVGGLISEDIIDKLKFGIIIGGANNLLKASSQEEEFVLAGKLAARGILYQVEWWHNVGGVLCGCEEYENQENASMVNVLKKVEDICTKHTWENFEQAKERGITPTENAYRSAEDAIYAKQCWSGRKLFG
jgi:glutamate dehydrogenase/leucine dehydrogenase